ncbi:chorismate mutase [Streptomyces sp. MUM 136J]|uniref:chorismate mutase n=1 Tax=Streptomyces sp. MUM 136J TaxID=2791992 RepID=UPI0023D916A7|nr:chorismate mutase [Streptomyces sp. MUM 136J]
MTATAAEKTGATECPKPHKPHECTDDTQGTGTPERAGTGEKTGTVEKTGARTAEGAGVITGARERIDALDDRIIGLIQERTAVSAVIQEARIASGGRRVNLSREMEVLARYREALGKPGTALAMTLLELCRGRI